MRTQLSSPVSEVAYKAITERNFRSVPQIEKFLSEQQKRDIEIVGRVLPFKANNYVVDELIDWENFTADPIFILTFPQKDMLSPLHYGQVAEALEAGMDKASLDSLVNDIRLQLNPHPAGQAYNVPLINGEPFYGVQHKYRETLLFFPSQGQTCHAYCTFCFRWPQFVGMDDMKFASRETDLLVTYLQQHREVTDVLFTGGDPMIMKARIFAQYIEPLLEADIPNLQTIRIGTKALGYWPYKFTTDPDAADMLALFRKITSKGINLSIMAHFNHPAELSTEAVKEAVLNLRKAGVQIRSQSPLLRHINDRPEIWAAMWREQVNQNIIPYYMFLSRDTGAQDYFAVPLAEAHRVFREAYQEISGICRTVRGPSMSCDPGKVQILGVSEVYGEKVFALRFLQGRNPDWVCRPFFARYDEKVIWLDQLKPAFGEEKFFFEEELADIYERKKDYQSQEGFE
jgi:KamA family protein